MPGHKVKLTEPFEVRTGVRQSCLLSPTIFFAGSGLDIENVHRKHQHRDPLVLHQTAG